MISALKPIGVPVALTLIIIGLIQIKKINQFFLILIFFNSKHYQNFFYSNFNKKTVFKHSVAGKLFILSGKFLKLTIIRKISVRCYVFENGI